MNVKDFPILRRKVNDKRLVYLDNAATTQKPKQVISKITDYYENYNANIHRGIHKLSEEATEEYEAVRGKTAKFIGAKPQEIVFTKNTTESLNILAYSAMRTLQSGDEVVLSVMEHHSNIVPWQMLQNRGVKLKFIDINSDGTLKDAADAITNKTKIVSIIHASNVLGTINNVAEIGKIARENGAAFIVDGAQSAPHMPVDVKKIGADFYAFSSHKMLGPTGVGVLFGKQELLEKIHPFIMGGDMIKSVSLRETSFNDLPWRFEAGTPNIADVIGFGAAIDYLNKTGMNNVRKHELQITKYAISKLEETSGVKIYGPSPEKRGGVVSFSIDGVHPHDVASILDGEGIAIRSGHMCAQPLMERLNVPALNRMSFYIYNTKKDIDSLVKGIEKIKKIFKVK